MLSDVAKLITVLLCMFPLFADWQVKRILLCILWELRGCKSGQGAMYGHGDRWPKDPCGFLYYPACSYTHPWNLHGETHLVCNWFEVLEMSRRQPYELLNVYTVTFDERCREWRWLFTSSFWWARIHGDLLPYPKYWCAVILLRLCVTLHTITVLSATGF